MTETRAYRISRLFDDKNYEVMFGTRLETEGDFVKIYDEDTLVYLHKGFNGAVKDIGSKENYFNGVRVQNEVQATMMKIKTDYWASKKW